jgi:hypothetical protein
MSACAFMYDISPRPVYLHMQRQPHFLRILLRHVHVSILGHVEHLCAPGGVGEGLRRPKEMRPSRPPSPGGVLPAAAGDRPRDPGSHRRRASGCG